MGLVETSVTAFLGIQSINVTADQNAEVLFVDQLIVTAVLLGVIYGLTRSFHPHPDDIFCYNWKEPFNLEKRWLLLAVVGIIGALLAISLTEVALSLFNGETPEREKDALVLLSPLIGSFTKPKMLVCTLFPYDGSLYGYLCLVSFCYFYSWLSTALLVGIGVLAPLFEETLFRGFLMVSLTKWFPTPVSVIISAAAFALAPISFLENFLSFLS